MGTPKETVKGPLKVLTGKASVQNNEKLTFDSEEFEAKKTNIERGKDEEAP